MSDAALNELLAAMTVDGNSGVIESCNRLCGQLLGWEPEDLVGKPLDTVIPERSRKVHKGHRKSYMRAPVARPMGPDREVYMVRSDGSEIRVWVGLAPIADGKVMCAIVSVENQTGPLNPVHPTIGAN